MPLSIRPTIAVFVTLASLLVACHAEPDGLVDECATDNGGCDPLTACTNTPQARACGVCPPGFTGDGEVGCTDVDECALANGGCDPLSTCTNTPGSRTCGGCPAGYLGEGETGCSDVDECAAANGGCAQSCTNSDGSSACSCVTGYLLAADGKGCDDVDECATAENGGCDSLTTCINTAGARTCSACPGGYAGTGATGCDDVDECLAENGGCDSLTTCTNTAGARTCSACPSGYTGTGATGCVDVDECLAANGGCDALTTCANTGGSRTCGACIAGYFGNGAGGCVQELAGIAVAEGTLVPEFSPSVVSYRVDVPIWAQTVAITATAGPTATLTVDATPATGGTAAIVSVPVLGSNTVTVVVSAAGTTKTYTLDVRRGAGIDYLKPSNTDAGDYFGYAIAISADTLVVGDPSESSCATGVNGDGANNGCATAGAAYVFTRSGATWSQQAYLKASNTGVYDLFGYSVGVSGDTVVVGSYFEDSCATGVNGDGSNSGCSAAGAAYVFTRSGATWSQQAYLEASNTGAYDLFGSSVGVAGDTVVVGAYHEASCATGVGADGANNSCATAGAAYVFTRSGAAWSQQAYLKASNTDSGDLFGNSVGVSGDTLVVSALGEDSCTAGVGGDGSNNLCAAAGAAYVFTRSGATWSQQAYLKDSNTDSGDFFGYFVGVSGDAVVVGADSDDSCATGVGGDSSDNGCTNAGAVYTYRFCPVGTALVDEQCLYPAGASCAAVHGS